MEEATFITSDALLEEWQGHRRLTRKVIEAFPEDKLFTYSIGGMRPFSQLAMEMLRMAVAGLKAIISGKWQTWEELTIEHPMPKTKKDLLLSWDKTTSEMYYWWKRIPKERFQEKVISLAGQYEGPSREYAVYTSILYLIDNEIHHRAQGYVYLRSLNIEPPLFWERD
jgi:uncharacterized damage-inducible protein DinB